MSKAQQEIRKALDAVGYTHDRMTVEFTPGGEFILMEGYVANGWSVDGCPVGANWRDAVAYIQGEFGLDDLLGAYWCAFEDYHPADPLIGEAP